MDKLAKVNNGNTQNNKLEDAVREEVDNQQYAQAGIDISRFVNKNLRNLLSDFSSRLNDDAITEEDAAFIEQFTDDLKMYAQRFSSLDFDIKENKRNKEKNAYNNEAYAAHKADIDKCVAILNQKGYITRVEGSLVWAIDSNTTQKSLFAFSEDETEQSLANAQAMPIVKNKEYINC